MSIPIFFLVLLFAVPTHQISDIVTKTCDQTLYKAYCKTELGSAPVSDVKDLKSLTVFALKMASLKGVAIVKSIDKFTKATQDEFAQQCLSDCAEIYQDAIDQLEDSTAAVDAKKYNDVNTWVTAAMTDSTTCEDSFKENKGTKSPLTAENTKFSNLCSIILTMSNLLAKTK
ncbi:putative invertase inhibitor [Mercurialis annua]|uniref:putative invertase inhibitor n=1 Tax=Mercurialis annua TaxID=3986 RepID=UPI002160B607|nr:putative invertase inhibitor [Mercurialis annua]